MRRVFRDLKRAHDIRARPLVLIFEPQPDGHRYYYVRVVAEELLRRGMRVVVLTGLGVADRPEFRVYLRPLVQSNQLEIHAVALALGHGLAPNFRRASVVLRSTADLGIETVVIPDGDRILGPWTLCVLWQRLLRRAVPHTSVLLMRPPVRTGIAGRPPQVAAKYAKALSVHIAVRTRAVRRICYLFGEVKRETVFRSGACATWCRDPVSMLHSSEERMTLRRTLDIPTHEPVFLIIGSLSERKGISAAIAAWSALPSQERPLLLLVGAVCSDAAVALRGPEANTLSASRRLMVRDEYVDSELFDAYIAAADFVILAYTNEGASGILGKARAAGVPVIVAGSEYLLQEAGDRLSTVNVGSSPDALAAGIRYAVLHMDKLQAGALTSRDDRSRTEAEFAAGLLNLSERYRT